MSLDVLTIGDSVVDIIVSVPQFPTRNEETVQSNGMNRFLGGSSNFLIMLSRLGLSVGVIDQVGYDDFGHFYRESLAGEGVDVSNLKTSNTQTAHCICMVDKNGNHSYVSFPGATYNLSKEDIDPAVVSRSKSLYVSGYSLTTQPIRDATLKAVQIAAENQLKIYFDPSPRISDIPLDTIQKVIEHTNGLFINTTEYSVLTSKLPPRVNLPEMCDFIALKQGEKGCTVFSGGKKQVYAGHTVDVVDTTGAGDVFNAAFIFGQISGWEIHRCATLANRLAAEKVKRLGAGLNVPSRQQVKKILSP